MPFYCNACGCLCESDIHSTLKYKEVLMCNIEQAVGFVMCCERKDPGHRKSGIRMA